MSMKKFDLAKQMGMKVTGQMKGAGVPGRFGQGATEVLDKREQRKRDTALGLVPFACKLPSELTRRLNERAQSHEGGMTGLLVELLSAALDAKAEAKPKAAVKGAAQDDSAGEKPATPAPAKKKSVSRKP